MIYLWDIYLLFNTFISLAFWLIKYPNIGILRIYLQRDNILFQLCYLNFLNLHFHSFLLQFLFNFEGYIPNLFLTGRRLEDSSILHVIGLLVQLNNVSRLNISHPKINLGGLVVSRGAGFRHFFLHHNKFKGIMLIIHDWKKIFLSIFWGAQLPSNILIVPPNIIVMSKEIWLIWRWSFWSRNNNFSNWYERW